MPGCPSWHWDVFFVCYNSKKTFVRGPLGVETGRPLRPVKGTVLFSPSVSEREGPGLIIRLPRNKPRPFTCTQILSLREKESFSFLPSPPFNLLGLMRDCGDHRNTLTLSLGEREKWTAKQFCGQIKFHEMYVVLSGSRSNGEPSHGVSDSSRHVSGLFWCCQRRN